ncbi:MAG: hypothetical protein ACRYGR_04730 [Janthinobacterium lividum]
MNLPPQRIMIFGRPGSGKSTFAHLLHQVTKLPVYHLDKIFFISNWNKRNHQEYINLKKTFVDEEHWIIDGNNTKCLEMRYARADLVLYFNYSRRICCWRIFKRLWTKDFSIDDRAERCPEVLRWPLILYMWTFEKRVAKQIQNLKVKYPYTKFIEIRHDRDLAQLKKDMNL